MRYTLVLCLFVVGSTAACASPSTPTVLSPGSSEPAGAVPTDDVTATPEMEVGDDIARLLADPPEPGEDVEIVAYLPWGLAFPGFGHEERTDCPPPAGELLTDRPFVSAYRLLNTYRRNSLADEEPWLVPVSWVRDAPIDEADSGQPYIARLRGRLGSELYADCPSADRIFVYRIVEVLSYDRPTPQPRIEDPEWPVYRSDRYGYELPLPPQWTVEEMPDGVVAIRSSEWPRSPITVRVEEGEPSEETIVDQILDAGGNTYRQDRYPPRSGVPLSGYWSYCPAEGDLECVRALLVSMGRTYELQMPYPVGFDVQPELMEIYGAVVNDFSVAGQPTATPWPTMVPLREELGDGPLVDEAQAIDSLRAQLAGPWRIVRAQLLSEAAVAKLVQDAGDVEAACAGTYRIPLRGDGFWVVTVEPDSAGASQEQEHYLIDGTTGSVLCHVAASPTMPAYP